MTLLGDGLAGVDTDDRTLYLWGEMIIDSANSAPQSVTEGIGDEDVGVEIRRSEGQTRDDIYLGVGNWVELYPFVVRSIGTGPSDFEGIGDENAGIELHRGPGDTRDGTYVDREYWVELFGEEVIYEQRLQGSDGEYIPNGELGTVYCLVQYCGPDSASFGAANLKLTNVDTENVLLDESEDGTTSSYDPGDSQLFIVAETAPDGHDLSNDEIEIDLQISDGDPEAKWRVSYGNTLESDHRHEAEAGIIGFRELTPTNVDVIVNNETVAENIGSGEFEAQVDLTDQLNQGEWNEMRLTSDSLGHIQAFGNVLAYRQIGQNPDN